MPDRRGVATSTFFVGLDAGQGLGPVLGGVVLNAFDFSTVFMGTSAMLLLGMLGFIAYKRKLASSH
jgi:predicted MFS family arabinose efflux permease